MSVRFIVPTSNTSLLRYKMLLPQGKKKMSKYKLLLPQGKKKMSEKRLRKFWEKIKDLQTTQNPPNVSWLMWNLEMGHIFFSSQRNMRLQCHGVNDACIYICCIIWSSYVLSLLWGFTECTKTHPVRGEKGEIDKYCNMASLIRRKLLYLLRLE